MNKAILAAIATGTLASAAAAQDAPATDVTKHYYAMPSAKAGTAHPWLIMLPGGGGIDVFGDGHFYFDKAKEWNEAGWDVLVLHYQEAAKLVPGAVQDNMAKMEMAVVADAMKKATEKGWLDLQCPGMVMGFSAGGAGTLALADAPPRNLIGAVGFYPAVRGQVAKYSAKVPVLALQGDLDQLTPRATLDDFVAKSGDPAKFSVFHFPMSHHGFDIPSLVKPVEWNGGSFQYNEGSALQAQAQVVSFRTAQLAAANAPAECRN